MATRSQTTKSQTTRFRTTKPQTTGPQAAPAAGTLTLTRAGRIGLGAAGFLAALDLAGGIAMLADGLIPAIMIAVAVATFAGIAAAWRGRPWGRTLVVATRALSAVSALPAFFVGGVPAGWVTAAGVGIVLQLAVIALVVLGSRRSR